MTTSNLPTPTPAVSAAPAAEVMERVRAGAVEAALEAIITIDERHRVVMANPAALQMFGCDAASVLGSDLSRFIPERLRERHAVHVHEFDASGVTEMAMGERRILVGLRSDGEEFPIEISISRVNAQGESGSRSHFTALIRDLSETHRLRREIETLNKHVRGIFELAPVAIWITKQDRIVFANRACATLFGAPGPQALIGRPIYSLLVPESHESVRQMIAQSPKDGTPLQPINERIARLDGTVREVEIAAAELPLLGGTVLQMVITDVTERRRESLDLHRSRSELRQLSANLVNAREEERRRIARELHDELGQQLTAMKMELTSLGAQVSGGVLNQRIAMLCEMVDQTVGSVRRIATDLRPLILDDLGLIAAIEWLARESARRLGIDIALRLGESDPPVGDAGVIALYRMVQEALTNIARHSQATRASIELQRTADELVLIVQDNGVGLAEDAALTEGSHGLMGIRERAHMLGGTLEIGSAQGGGGRITVRLPLLPAATDTPISGAATARPVESTEP